MHQPYPVRCDHGGCQQQQRPLGKHNCELVTRGEWLFQIVQVALKLLEHCHGRTEQCSSIMRALAAAAQAAMAVNPATTAGIAEGLVAAEAGAAGSTMPQTMLQVLTCTHLTFSQEFSTAFCVKTYWHSSQEQPRTSKSVQRIATSNQT